MYENDEWLPCMRQPYGPFYPAGQQMMPAGAMMQPGMPGYTAAQAPGAMMQPEQMMPAGAGMQPGMPGYPAAQAPGVMMPGGMAPEGAGFPGGITTIPGMIVPSATLGGVPIAPLTTENINFVPGYLRTQIGRRMKVEFLIGTSSMTDRSGTLLGVGASYILLRPEESDDIMMADLYSIKFVTIFL